MVVLVQEDILKFKNSHFTRLMLMEKVDVDFVP